MTFYADPSVKSARVALFYRNFLSVLSHVGLGVNALHTAKVLRRQGVIVDVYGVREPPDVRACLDKMSTLPTHAVIEAPWISIEHMSKLLADYPTVHFIVRAHSQIGFLQVEAGAIALMRQLIRLEEMNLNFSVAANSEQLCHFIRRTYNARCLYLPNLYDTQRAAAKRGVSHAHRLLRIGCFGALRLLKNHTTSAAAAMLIAERRSSDLELYINVNREENVGSRGIRDSLRNMFAEVPWARLIECPWADWSSFRQTVANMDLCMQLSFTETFNLATADACAEGVPSVVSDAIEWAPSHWKAPPDNAEVAARIGSHLLSDVHAADEGLAALRAYVDRGTVLWMKYLSSNPT